MRLLVSTRREHRVLSQRFPAPLRSPVGSQMGAVWTSGDQLDGGHTHRVGTISFRTSDHEGRYGGLAAEIREPAPVEQDDEEISPSNQIFKPVCAGEFLSLPA